MSPDSILTRAAELFGVSLAAIIGTSRSRQAVAARQAVAYALRQQAWTVVAIGKLLRRDHTTICYATRAAEQRAIASPAYALDLLDLSQR